MQSAPSAGASWPCWTAFCKILEAVARKAEASAADHGKEITQILRSLAVRKPGTFWEATQLMYLYAVASGTYNYGRMDEYLGDFLARDLENGTLTEEEAQTILVDLWRLFIYRKTTWNGRVIVGGKGRRNEKNADQFALLAIRVAGIVRDVLPQFTLRFYEGQDPRLLDNALQGIGTGCVYPLLYNDDVNIPSVEKAFGVSCEEAEQYLPFGCGEYIMYHRSVGTPSDIINLLKALEVTLFNGYDHISQKPMGLKTGEFRDFPDFEAFYAAYCRQVEHFTALMADQQMAEYQSAARNSPFLMASLLYDDCIARAKPIFGGGVHYLGGTYETYGNINTANSLTAIKKLVFEEKKITPDQLLDMLEKNFQGYETERKLLLDAPKYGNDLEEADAMAVRVHEHICRFTQAQARRVGLDTYLVVVINNSANTTLGHFTMASADGRLAGDALANANNPAGGTDTHGLTAMLNSLVRLKTDIHAGSVQNIKFSKEMFQKHYPQTRAALDVYFENGGSQIMINVLGRKDLEEALKHPEQYQNLIVRVGGFCARFVELSADVQKEVMRCAHTFGDANDYAKLILQAEGAPLLDVEISSANGYTKYTWLVEGTRGCLIGNVSRLDWKYYIEGETAPHEVVWGPLRNEKGEPIYCGEKLPFHEEFWEAQGEETNDFNCKGLIFYRTLYRHLTEGTAFPIENSQVRKQIAVMEEAHRQNAKYMPQKFFKD